MYHTSRDESCYTIISEAFTSPLCLQVFKSLTTHQRPLPSSWEQRTFSLEILTFLYLYSPQNRNIFKKKFEKDLRLAIPLFPRNSTRHFQHIKPRLSPELCQSFSGELNWADIQAYTSQLAATGGYSKAWLGSELLRLEQNSVFSPPKQLRGTSSHPEHEKSCIKFVKVKKCSSHQLCPNNMKEEIQEKSVLC